MLDDNKNAELPIETTPSEIEKYKPSTIEVLKAMERGMTAKEATLLVKGKTSLTPTAESRIRDKYKKYSLSRPAMVKLAHKAVQETLAMKPIITSDGKEIHPSHTNRLAAAAMVADRAEPIVRANLNINAEVEAPVDLDALRGLFNR